MAKTIICRILLIAAGFIAGCGPKEEPPYFKAVVQDIWNQEIVVENFKILYWWEERGETPFLKPYYYHAKELIVELLIPIGKNSRKVNVVTKRIPLQNIEEFFFMRGEVENNIKVKLKNGEEVVATDRFPKILRKGKDTGFADYQVFLEGKVMKDKKREEFKLALDQAKQVQIIETLF